MAARSRSSARPTRWFVLGFPALVAGPGLPVAKPPTPTQHNPRVLRGIPCYVCFSLCTVPPRPGVDLVSPLFWFHTPITHSLPTVVVGHPFHLWIWSTFHSVPLYALLAGVTLYSSHCSFSLYSSCTGCVPLFAFSPAFSCHRHGAIRPLCATKLVLDAGCAREKKGFASNPSLGGPCQGRGLRHETRRVASR